MPKPVTPGEMLLEEFLLPTGLTKYRLAKEIGVLAQRIGEIVAGHPPVSWRAFAIASTRSSDIM
jgi:antitoxin HigA-1